MSRALCAPEHNPPVDLTDIDSDTHADIIAVGRELCGRCPVLVACRRESLTGTDMAGMAGGMTETERTEWRARHGVNVQPPDIVDVTPAHALTPTVLDDLPVVEGTVPDRVVEVVLRMSRAHVSAEDIVTALDHPSVTHRTVKYLRHRYMKGPTRVDI